MKYFIIFVWWFVHCSVISDQNNNLTLFEPEKIVEDIDFLLESLNDIHPTFNQYLSENAFQTKIDSLKNATLHPLSKHEFFKIMQPLIAVDGHTSLRFDGKIYPDIEDPFFPFKIIINNGQIYVKENLSIDKNIKKGMVIESINGIQTSIIINQLSKYIPHDGSLAHPYKTASVFHIFYHLVFGNYSEFSLVINDDGERKRISVPGVKLENFESQDKPQFDFRMLEDSVAYFYIGAFRKPDFFMAYIDSIFSILKENKIEYLIIDKRSGGGFTSLTDSLLSYLTDKSFKQFEKKAVKISSANQDYVNENKSNGIIKDGYLILEYPPSIPFKRKNMFNGKTFILMNYETTSAATYFVSAIKCNKIATLVGQEAAQPLISNGDPHGFKLPNTKMTCYSSMSTYYFPCAVNRNESVKPDYEVKFTIEDLLNNSDKCLEYTLELIENDKIKTEY
jgi:hypothetical protein